MTPDELEAAACLPHPISPNGFNPHVVMPYGCSTDHIQLAMKEFIDFLGFVNTQLHSRSFPRLESFLMPANFSSMVGEFMAAGIPKHCPGLVRNKYHNGHPDMFPAGRFTGDAALHAQEGIEIKASRYMSGWQGHNPENVWLMVFVFDSNTSRDEALGIAPRPLRIIKVVGALLVNEDWSFAGRSAGSRRTITASVTPSDYEKMESNWIYQDPEPPSRGRRPRRRG